MSPPGWIWDLATVASFFGVTEKQIRVWSNVGMPVVSRGTQGGARKKTLIDIREAVAWRNRQVQAEVGQLDLEQERARLAKEQADKTALDNAARRGELADLNAVARVWGQMLASYRARMLGAAAKLAPQVNPENPNLARDIIAAEHELILLELSQLDVAGELEELGEGATDPDDEREATAAPDGERVGGQVSSPQPRKQRRARKVEH